MVQHDSCSLERLVSSFLLVEINSSSREGLPLTNKRERSSGTRILLHNYYEAMLRYSTDIRRSNFFVKFQFGNGVTLREIYLNLWLVKRKLEGSAKIKSKIEKHPILTFSLIRSLDWSFRLIHVLKIKEKEKKTRDVFDWTPWNSRFLLYFHLRLFADARIHFRAAFVPRESIARLHTRMLRM